MNIANLIILYDMSLVVTHDMKHTIYDICTFFNVSETPKCSVVFLIKTLTINKLKLVLFLVGEIMPSGCAA